MEIYELLKKDHRTVQDLFKRIESTMDERGALMDEIDQELRAHSEAEDAVFYAYLETQDETREMILEGREKHKIVTQLLDELTGLDTEDEEFSAKLKVLKELVEHHVEEEENEMFKEARKVIDKDLAADLGERFTEEKQAYAH